MQHKVQKASSCEPGSGGEAQNGHNRGALGASLWKKSSVATRKFID